VVGVEGGTDPPKAAAAGVHLPWAQVPDRIQEWAAAVAGAAPHRVHDLPGGFSPGATTRLQFAGRPDLFVKAVGAALNPESPELHRREAVIAAGLPRSPRWPELITTYDDGDWVALAFVAVDGQPPKHPWQRSELDVVVHALEAMHVDLAPSPIIGAEAAATRLLGTFGGWRRLASMTVPPSTLDQWSRRNLLRLAELESAWPDACAGETLLHLDIRSDNILIDHDRVVFVDWPHAGVGSPVLDLICWAPSVVLEGGPEPESLLARYNPSGSADPDVVNVLVAAVAGFLTERSLLPSPPGLPTLRAFQAAQADVARSWLQRRVGW
jgi:hypothetical protein